MTRWLLLAGRLILGGIFVYAAYAKLRLPWIDFAGALNAFEILPEAALEPVARTLPWCELALGVALISGIWQRWFALMASLLLGFFFSVMVRSYAMGLKIDCGCFGPGEALGPKTLARDFSMLALAVAVTVWVFPYPSRKRSPAQNRACNRLEYEGNYMRRILAFLPALAITAGLFAQAPSASKEAPFTPRKADEFVIHMTDGSQKLLSSYRGKVVVMAFMFTTCTHCQHTAGVLSKIQTDYAAKGVQMLGVTIDAGAREGIPMFMKVTGANFPVGYTDQVQAMKFLHGPSDGWYVPMLAFIDKAGMIRSEYIVTEPGDAPSKFLEAQETNIPKEIDKFLAPATGHTAARPATPASKPASKP